MGKRKAGRKKAASSADSAVGATPEDLQLARNELLSAVEDYGDSSPREFLRLFQYDNSSKSIKAGLSTREQKQLLLQAVEHLGKAPARRFFAGLSSILTVVLENEDYIPESAYEDDTEDQEIVVDAKSSKNLHFLHLVALVTKTHLDGQAKKHSERNPQTPLPVLEEVFQIAESLHTILFALNSCGPDAVAPQSTIVSLCTSWWIHNAAHRENLVAFCLPLLVNRALGDGPSFQSDIKRLFQMREAFQLIDFEDPDSDDLKSLLMRVASSPSCLRVAEGRRFLAHLFHADRVLIPDLHRAMRVHIPDNRKTILEAYGEIYFRAWKEAPDEEEESPNESGDDEAEQTTRQFIEEHVLSDLVYAVIHVANPTMSKSLLTVLRPFHDAKKTPAVENLLHRLYGPILWRSLSSANARVRLQAAQVLARVFPLQDDSHTRTDQAVRRACTALEHLLQDRDARVRVAGSEVVAQILTTYWDVLPAETIRSLLNHIVAEHASDASSAAVRAGALNAVALLLEAPESHAVIRPLLPSLGNLIHDKVETVRVAAVGLLLRIKKTPGIKYYHVVPVDHLTARLAEEGRVNPQNAVSSGITALMLNSYFPQGKSATEQIQRTLTFLSNDPEAAHVFYSNVAVHLPLNAVAQLAGMLLRCLHSAVKTDQKKAKQITAHSQKETKGKKRRKHFGRTTEADKENEETEQDSPEVVEDDETLLTASNTALMSNLAETICTLWQSIETDLQQNEECNQSLIKEFSGSTLTDVLTHFEEKAREHGELDDTQSIKTRDECLRTCAAILRLAGNLSSKAVKGLVPYISSVLAASAESDLHPRQNVSTHIALLCLWGMTEDVAPSLASSIEADFEGYHELLFDSPDANSKKRKSGRPAKKSSAGLAMPRLAPVVALDVLGDILRGADPSSVAAREAILCSPTASACIERALHRGTRHAERILAGDLAFTQSLRHSDLDFVLRVCEAYGRFVLHKQASDGECVTFSKQAEELLQWTTHRVVPALLDSREDVPFSDPDLSTIAGDKSFVSLCSSPIPTGPPKRRPNLQRTPERLNEESRILQSPHGEQYSNAVGRAFAVSLMQSSCVIFSEWLAVGGAGAKEIDIAATEWCKIFQNGQPDESTELDIQNELLPAFARLAMQLCKTSDQFSLLKELLVACRETEDEESMIALRKALSSLLLSRGTQSSSLITKTIACILRAAYVYVDRESSELDYKLPASMGDLWSHELGTVALALNAILASKHATIAFAQRLADSVANDADQNEARALFHVKCLWIICDYSASSKSLPEIVNIVRRIDTATMEQKDELRNVFDELKQAIA